MNLPINSIHSITRKKRFVKNKIAYFLWLPTLYRKDFLFVCAGWSGRPRLTASTTISMLKEFTPCLDYFFSKYSRNAKAVCAINRANTIISYTLIVDSNLPCGPWVEPIIPFQTKQIKRKERKPWIKAIAKFAYTARCYTLATAKTQKRLWRRTGA